MTDLLYAGGNNIAGLFLVRCAPVAGILTLPLPAPAGPLTVSGAPTFRTGFGFVSIYGTEATKAYEENMDESDNGEVWSVKLSLFHPSDSPAVRTSLRQMARHRFLLECQDNTGLWRRAGTKEQSMALTYRFEIDADAGGRRGYRLNFAGSMTAPPAFIN